MIVEHKSAIWMEKLITGYVNIKIIQYKGLEVYVWQMAEGDYRFGLMQGTNREKTLFQVIMW